MPEPPEGELPRSPDNPPPLPPDEGTGAPPPTPKEQVEEILTEYQNTVDATIEEILVDGNEEIEDSSTNRKAEFLRERLKKLLKAARSKETRDQFDFLPQEVQDLLRTLDPGKITKVNSPLLFELLKGSMEQDLNDHTVVEFLLADLYGMRALDERLVRSILEPITEKGDAVGAEQSLVDEVGGYIESSQKKDVMDQLINSRTEFGQKQKRTMRLLKNLPVHGAAIERAAQGDQAAIQKLVTEGFLDEDIPGQIRSERIKNAQQAIRGRIIDAYQKVLRAITPEDRDRAQDEYSELLGNLENEKYIEQDKLLEVQNQTETMFEVLDSLTGEDGERNVLLGEAARAGFSGFSEKQKKLVAAMGGDYSTFKQFLRSERYLYHDAATGELEIKWPELSEEIRAIFEEILNVAGARPNDFFNEAFNEFYEGHFYRVLLLRLDTIGRHISEDSELKNKPVKLEETIMMENVGQPGWAPGKEPLSYLGEGEQFLWEAMGVSLRNQMTTFKNDIEFLHNTEAIVENGMGWETLAQQAERIAYADIFWLMHNDKVLNQAYNLYLTNLKNEFATNRHIATGEFGKKDKNDFFDHAQRLTYEQLLAMEHLDPGQTEPSHATTQKMKRIVRMASAISKGITGDYWSVVISQRMPGTRERASRQAKDNKGNLLWDTDPQGQRQPKMEEYFKYKPTFNSASASGFERMIGQLDLDITLERFGVPDIYHAIRFAYVPRDLKKFKGAYSRDRFNGFYDHADVHDLKLAAEDAAFSGRSDFLAEFDEDNEFLMDALRTNSVGLPQRGGWRLYEYKADIKYAEPTPGQTLDTETAEIDFEATLHNLKQSGPKAIQAFADDKDAFKRLPSQIQNQFRDYDEYKLHMYEKYIFERTIDVSPSQWFGDEQVRYSPKGEDFINDHMTECLSAQFFGDVPKEYVRNHVMKLFTSSLSMTEKMRWERGGISEPLANPQRPNLNDERFKPEDLDGFSDELKRYFISYKRGVALRFPDANGRNYNLDAMDEEQFFTMMKGFHTELLSHLRAPKRSRQDVHAPMETLSRRYAVLMSKKMGHLDHLVGGSTFNYGEFKMTQAGRRVGARWASEANVIATKHNPALMALINEGIPGFVLAGYTGGEEMKKGIDEQLVKHIAEASLAVGVNIDPMEGRRIAVKLGIFMERILAKDRKYRIKGIGNLFETLSRAKRGVQSTLMSDTFKQHLGRPVTRMETEDLAYMGRKISQTANVEWTHKGTPTYEEMTGLFSRFVKKASGGRIIRRRVISHEENDVHMGQYRKAVGAGGGARFIEQFLPIGVLIFMLMILAQMRSAFKANQQK